MADQELRNRDEFPRDRSKGDKPESGRNQPDTSNPGQVSEPSRDDESGGSGRGKPGPQRQSDDDQ